jgi:5'-methylthioadenosine phosphorylase
MTNAPISLAVIGGSGLYAMPGLIDVEEVAISTPFGDPSDAVITGTLNARRVAFLPRHGRGHRHNPSEVPYRANIWALKSLGVKHVLSVSACGSLRDHLQPRDIVVPDQLFDFTKGKRAASFFDAGVVGHVSVGDPLSKGLSAAIAAAARQAGGIVHEGGTFITVEGPRFSTRAESHAFRAWGCDIIGMTACPEAFLAREAEMDFGIMAHVTDYDVWHEEEDEVTVEMVIERLHANLELAQKAIVNIVEAVETLPHESAGAMKFAVMTARERITPEAKERLKLLAGDYL